jgi:hypothetical protein
MSQQLSADSLAGQTFMSAGSSDFPVAWPKAPDTGLESPMNRQAGKPALPLTARRSAFDVLSRRSRAKMDRCSIFPVVPKPRESGFRRYPLSSYLLFAILSLLSAIALPAYAVTSGSPYTGIVDRNVFGLKPPTPVAPPTAPEPPPGNITLTGITTILGNKRALLKVSTPPRPPEPAKDENLMLTEGQRDGAVEVLEINEKTGSVKVNNGGQITTLTFDKNGAKAVAIASGPGSISAIPAPHMGGQPGGIPGNSGPLRTIPTRTTKTGPQGQTPDNQTSSTPQINPNSLAAQAQFQTDISPDEQTLMIEAQRLDLQNKGKHEDAALFPPTDLTPNEGGISPQ